MSPSQSLLPPSLAQSLLPGTGYQQQLLAAQVQLQSGTAQLQAELLQSQARLAELEAQVRVWARGRGEAGLRWEGVTVRAGRLPQGPTGPASHPHAVSLLPQVRKLELERAQHTLLLETLQQRHQVDLELIESAHRYPLPQPSGLPKAPGLPQPCARGGPSGGRPHL